MRDVIGAWPVTDYWVYDNDGNYDKDVFSLPPEMCYCFRVPETYSEDEAEELDFDEDEIEDEDEDATQPDTVN